ncbi:MAG: phosphoglucosamine mutase [Phycisphaerales bacterium JB065]
MPEATATPASSTGSEPSAPAPLMLSVSGCRGIVGRSLTPEVVCRYANAVASWIAEARPAERQGQPVTIVLGRDGRQSGAMVRDLVVGTLVASGVRVIDLGVATTPTTGVAVDHFGADGAIILTASHNPQQWNGMKAVTSRGCAPPATAADQIISRYRAGDTAFADFDRLGCVEADDTATHVHVARVLEAVSKVAPIESIRAQRFRVVINSVNASGSRGAKLLMDALGCELVHLNDSTDGIFPHTPEPTEENLRDMCSEVIRAGAVIGFAQDPDADRLAIIDAGGRYIGEEYTLALSAWAVLESMESTSGTRIATNLSTSRMVEDIAARYGATVDRYAVGEANLVDAMLADRDHTPIGGEGNGGVVWPAIVPIRDSIGAMALVLALMTRTGRSLSDLVDDIPSYAIVKRKQPIRDGLADQALKAVQTVLGPRAEKIDDSDGVRVDLKLASGGDAWVHVRPSNTEPILRLIAEAPTQAAANELLDEVSSAI